MKIIIRLIPLLGALALAGCVTSQQSVPLPDSARRQGLSVVRALPEELPAKSSPFPHSQFVLIASENFAELANPVPFVADIITNEVHRSRAEAFEAKYRDIHPYRIAVASLQGSPLLAAGPAALQLKPFVFIQDCTDDRYRLTLVYDVRGGDWVGRYHYHLPSTYTPAEIDDPNAATQDRIRTELATGAVTLRGLLERDARGQLNAGAIKANVGSLHLVGGRALGLMSPTLVLARKADVVEETPDHIVVRITGNMTAPASGGGLFFGVHWFRPDQLHTFTKL